MAKTKARSKKKIIKIVIEKRSEPLKVPDIKVRDFPESNKIVF
jgi:hypothetical protein